MLPFPKGVGPSSVTSMTVGCTGPLHTHPEKSEALSGSIIMTGFTAHTSPPLGAGGWQPDPQVAGSHEAELEGSLAQPAKSWGEGECPGAWMETCPAGFASWCQVQVSQCPARLGFSQEVGCPRNGGWHISGLPVPDSRPVWTLGAGLEPPPRSCNACCRAEALQCAGL